MTRAYKIAFRRIPGFSRIFLQYLDLDPAALAFYQVAPAPEALFDKAREIAGRAHFPRKDMAAILRRQNRAFGCGARTLENIEALALPGSVAVLTGQQVGLFTGPLYTIYKALTAIRLAAELKDREVPAVPVFWMDTDDHDLAEVAQVYMRAPDGRAARHDWGRRLFGEAHARARPVGALALPEAIGECLAEYAACWPAGPAAAELRRQLEAAYAAGRTLAESFGRALHSLLGDRGLVLFDPMDAEAKRLAAPVFETAIAEADVLRASLLERGRELHEAGFHGQVRVAPDSTLLFLRCDDERKAVLRDGCGFGLRNSELRWTAEELLELARREAERFSPNVLLRPVVEDHLFPTAAYVGGPAEIAYFAQAEPLYRRFGRPMPVVWPRAGFTLLDEDSARLLEERGLSFEDVLQGEERVMDAIGRTSEFSEVARLIGDLREIIEKGLAELRPDAVALDHTLGAALDTARRKMLHNLERLRRRAARMESMQDAELRQQASRLLDACRPGGILQERVFGIHPYLARYGPALIDELYSLIRADAFFHCVVIPG